MEKFLYSEITGAFQPSSLVQSTSSMWSEKVWPNNSSVNGVLAFKFWLF